MHGLKRRASSFNTDRIDHLYQGPQSSERRFSLHYGDLSDTSNLTRIIAETRPDEIYNLGAMSHVAVSFEMPEYTADVDGIGTLRLLEAIRFLKLERTTRFYQASTSELYGKVQEIPQKETTPFYPRSPYAAAKLYAYWIVVNYREAYGMYACNGILFNHESPRRGETFVTRKITRGIARIKHGLESCLYMGNLDAKRDWGHARDYVRMQWMMLQQERPEDFVIATGSQYSVRHFIELACREAGTIVIRWQGTGTDEVGLDQSSGAVLVRVDARYFRPTEVETLLGDPSKARRLLGWVPSIGIDELCREMMAHDLEEARQEQLVKSHGLPCPGASTSSPAMAQLDTGIDPKARIYVAGHRGLVGSAVVRALLRQGIGSLLLRTCSELDLLVQAEVDAFFARERPELVVLAAAKRRSAASARTTVCLRRLHLAEPGDPEPRAACRLEAWGAAAALPRLELHLPARLPAAHARGAPADRAAGEDQRTLRHRQDRRAQDLRELQPPVRHLLRGAAADQPLWTGRQLRSRQLPRAAGPPAQVP